MSGPCHEAVTGPQLGPRKGFRRDSYLPGPIPPPQEPGGDPKKAILAVAASMLTSAYHKLTSMPASPASLPRFMPRWLATVVRNLFAP